VAGISERSRSAGGVKVLNAAEGERVVSVAWIAEQAEAVDQETPPTPEGPDAGEGAP